MLISNVVSEDDDKAFENALVDKLEKMLLYGKKMDLVIRLSYG